MPHGTGRYGMEAYHPFTVHSPIDGRDAVPQCGSGFECARRKDSRRCASVSHLVEISYGSFIHEHDSMSYGKYSLLLYRTPGVCTVMAN